MSLVLVIEDEHTLRASMARALERLPEVQVLQAADLAQARALLARDAPALVVSDLRLPDGCAVELLADIERSGRLVPVLFVSAWIGRYRAQIPDRPDVEIFEKPVPMQTLRHRVLEQLERRRAAVPAPFGVTDYLQLAALGRHSMLLRLIRERTQVGRLLVVAGEAWSARFEDLTGEAAARAAAVAQDLRVEVEPWPGESGPREIHQPMDFLLLEAFRLYDEATRPPELEDHPTPAVRAPDTVSWSPLPTQLTPTAEIDRLLDAGLDALLSRDYSAAWAAFHQVERLRPGDPVVRANLNRIRELGHAPAEEPGAEAPHLDPDLTPP